MKKIYIEQLVATKLRKDRTLSEQTLMCYVHNELEKALCKNYQINVPHFDKEYRIPAVVAIINDWKSKNIVGVLENEAGFSFFVRSPKVLDFILEQYHDKN